MDLVETDRGGKSTFHGPGQLVCYPILDLRRHGQDVKQYVRDLEEALIRTLIAARARGHADRRAQRRVAPSPAAQDRSIGVHISRWVTTHGYALNVDLDPAPFTEWITACGLEDAAFTTMARELDRPVTVAEVASRATRSPRLDLELEPLPPRTATASGVSLSRSAASTSRIPRPSEPASGEACRPERSRADGSFVAMLRFAPHATIHEHAGANDTLVVCLEGEGFTSVAGDRAAVESERAFWPAASRTASGPRRR